MLEKYLAELLAKANVKSPRDRAREISLLTEGAMVMILIHGDRSYANAAAGAAKRLLRGNTRRLTNRRDRDEPPPSDESVDAA